MRRERESEKMHMTDETCISSNGPAGIAPGAARSPCGPGQRKHARGPRARPAGQPHRSRRRRADPRPCNAAPLSCERAARRTRRPTRGDQESTFSKEGNKEGWAAEEAGMATCECEGRVVGTRGQKKGR